MAYNAMPVCPFGFSFLVLLPPPLIVAVPSCLEILQPPGLADSGGVVNVVDLIRAAKERAANVEAGRPFPPSEGAISSSSDGVKVLAL